MLLLTRHFYCIPDRCFIEARSRGRVFSLQSSNLISREPIAPRHLQLSSRADWWESYGGLLNKTDSSNWLYCPEYSVLCPVYEYVVSWHRIKAVYVSHQNVLCSIGQTSNMIDSLTSAIPISHGNWLGIFPHRLSYRPSSYQKFVFCNFVFGISTFPSEHQREIVMYIWKWYIRELCVTLSKIIKCCF